MKTNSKTNSKKVRIAIILDTYPATSETFLYTLIENLLNQFQISIYARKRGSSPHKFPLTKEVAYLPHEGWPLLIKALFFVLLFGKFFTTQPTNANKLFKKISRENLSYREKFKLAYRLIPLFLINADLIYLPFGGLAVKYLEYILWSPIPVVFSLRGSDINIDPLLRQDYRERLKQALLSAEGVHCVCADIFNKAENLAGKPIPNSQVIYTALSPVFLNALPTRKTGINKGQPFQIVSVGRLDWRKGLEYGALAVRALLDRGIPCHWDIIGEGSYRIAIEYTIRDLEIESCVSIRGGMPQAEIRDILAKADVYFHPAIHEGISNAVVEAMAIGLPVVVADVGGIKEVISNKNLGYVIPARDWRAMADALEEITTHPEKLRTMGCKGHEYAISKFSLDNQRTGFHNLFMQALIRNDNK